VVRHVRVRDVVVEVVEPPVRAVHCGKRAAQPVPLRILVVRQRPVSVLKQSDHDLWGGDVSN